MCRIDAPRRFAEARRDSKLPASREYHALLPFDQSAAATVGDTCWRTKSPRRKAALPRGRVRLARFSPALNIEERYRLVTPAPRLRPRRFISNDVSGTDPLAKRSRIHSGLMFAAFMIGHHFSISDL